VLGTSAAAHHHLRFLLVVSIGIFVTHPARIESARRILILDLIFVFVFVFLLAFAFLSRG